MRAISSTLSVAMVTAVVGCASLVGLEDSVPYAPANDAGSLVSDAAGAEGGSRDVQATSDAPSADVATDGAVVHQGYVFPSCSAATNSILCFDSFEASQWSSSVCTVAPSTDPSFGSILDMSADPGGSQTDCGIARTSSSFDGTKGFRIHARVRFQVGASGYATLLNFEMSDAAGGNKSWFIVGAVTTGVEIWAGYGSSGQDVSTTTPSGWQEIELHVDPAGPDRVFVNGAQLGGDLDYPLANGMTASLTFMEKVKSAAASSSFDDIVMVPY